MYQLFFSRTRRKKLLRDEGSEDVGRISFINALYKCLSLIDSDNDNPKCFEPVRILVSFQKYLSSLSQQYPCFVMHVSRSLKRRILGTVKINCVNKKHTTIKCRVSYANRHHRRYVWL